MLPSPAERKTALITGATSGIGFALARVFAHEGYNLVLVGRNEETLLARADELSVSSGITVTVVTADLTLPTAPIEVYRELEYNDIPVDVLVNNAGMGLRGYFAESDWQEELAMISLNIITLSRLTKLFVRDMLERGQGRILNVASKAAFQPGPLMAVYHATKAYVLFFTEALHDELRGTGVTATALCPGPTRTNFYRQAKAHHVRISRGRMADPFVVARAGYDGMVRGSSVVVPGFLNKLDVLGLRLLPRRLSARLFRYMVED